MAVALACAGVAHSRDAQISRAAQRVHEKALTLDTHLDTAVHLARPGWSILDRHSLANDISQVDLPRMVSGGLDGGFWAIYVGQGERNAAGYARARDNALRIAIRLRELTLRHPDRFELALTSADAARIEAVGKRVVYLSIENAYPLGQDLTLLRTFHDLGVRMFGPVHFLNNDFGDSATDPKGPEWGGLSPLGRASVAEANKLGIVLDASHASDLVLAQLLELSAAPIVLSHSGCKAVFDHPRNIGDDLLKKLAAKGGVISMNSLAAYLVSVEISDPRKAALADLQKRLGHQSTWTAAAAAEFSTAKAAIDEQYPIRQVTIDDFMAHLLHALKVVGPEHVGIGADWDGGGGVVGLDDASYLPRITQRLLDAGYSEADIAKIWGGNVLRVMGEVERVRTRLTGITP